MLALLKIAPPIASPVWRQNYNPAHEWQWSTLWAAVPLLILLGSMMGLRMKGHRAALISLSCALLIALFVFHMPVRLAAVSTLFGAAYGIFPIFWILFPVLFIYHLTVRAGRFRLLERCLEDITEDCRLQLILIAFILGSFFEGAAGFGTPVVVCGTILLGLGFAPLEASAMVLLADTVPVALGSLGIPVVALHGITGLDIFALTRVVSVLLAPFCVLLPFWLVAAFAGFRKMCEVWPACLVAGTSFALIQTLVARVNGPWLVDISAALVTLLIFVLFLRVWKPKRIIDAQRRDITNLRRSRSKAEPIVVLRAAVPWAILTLFVAAWGTASIARWLNVFTLNVRVPDLDRIILRMPPVVTVPTPETAVFVFNWLSATGSSIFLAALTAAVIMRLRPGDVVAALRDAAISSRFTLVTFAALMGLAFLSRYCGMDVTIGLALARTGLLYPFFGTLIGWLGTASTGSDTSSNVLFGSLQKFAAEHLGISPALMASANSAGGVMGKMVAPQSVVVATTATGIYGKEGQVLGSVLLHSIAFACLMGGLVLLLVHVPALMNWILH